jgi:flagellar motor switch protein FliG
MSNGNPNGLIKEVNRDSGYSKAAKFLMLLGEEDAARVLKHLSEQEIEGVTREIAQIQRVDGGEAKKILEEFGYLARSRNLVARGGLVRAREMLEAAFGKERGETAYQRLLEKTDYRPFSFVTSLDLTQISSLLRDESVPVISLILSYLQPPTASKVFENLPREMQKEIARRIGRMEKIDPDVVRQAEESLRHKLQRHGEIKSLVIDGEARLMDIMKYLDAGTENFLLAELEEKDPELARSLKDRLFDYQLIYRIGDRDLQRILRDFTDREIAYLLKGKPDNLKAKVYANLSSRRQTAVQMDYEDLGEVPKNEAEKATMEFMNYVRQQVEMGELVMLEEDEGWLE